jgi:hypothetical protein
MKISKTGWKKINCEQKRQMNIHSALIPPHCNPNNFFFGSFPTLLSGSCSAGIGFEPRSRYHDPAGPLFAVHIPVYNTQMPYQQREHRISPAARFPEVPETV